MTTRSWVAAFVTVASLSACRGSSEPTGADGGAAAPPSLAPAALGGRLARLRAEFVVPDGSLRHQIVVDPEAQAVTARGARLAPIYDAGAIAKVELALPAFADEPFRVASRGVSLEARLVGAARAPAAIDGGAVFYDRALPGATLLHVPTLAGTEEYVRFATRPGARELRYDVTLGGASELRLVAGVLEVVGADGHPALHTKAPWIVDANGTLRAGRIAVEGCAVDTDPRVPWSHPAVAAGSARCTVVTSWDDAGLAYPLLVDPAWTDTGSLAQKRYDHRASLVIRPTGTCSGSGCVLVTGGVYTTTILNAVELYDVASGTFTSVASMPAGGTATSGQRHAHAQVTTADGMIVVAGGSTGLASTPLDLTAFYDVAAGTWTALGALPGGARSDLAAVRSTNGPVYVTGGTNGTSFSAATDVLTTSGTTRTWSAGNPMATPRAKHVIQGYMCGTYCFGYFVAGGQTTGGVATASVEKSENGAAYASAGALSTARWGLAAAIANSSTSSAEFVLLGGGWTTATVSSTVVDAFDLGVGKKVMLATKLGDLPYPSGSLAATSVGYVANVGSYALFTGGSYSNTNQYTGASFGQFINAAGSSSTSTTKMHYARADHQAIDIGSGRTLVIGGRYGACSGGCTGPSSYYVTYPAAEEIFQPQPNGAACTAANQCLYDNCVDGVCCSSACTDQCAACDVAGHVGTCSPVTGAPHGGRTPCVGTDPTCKGVCDGVNVAACNVPPTTQACITQSCTAGTQTNTAYCNGGGACSAPTTTACGIYACNAAGLACNTSCTSIADCASGSTCDLANKVCTPTRAAGSPCTIDGDCDTGLSCVDGACCTSPSCAAPMKCNLAPSAGTCKLPKGSACTPGGSDCASGFCVDGVCCDALCDGQCEACDVPGAVGTCSPVNGAPHGARTQCFDGGGDVCRAAACIGASDRTKCVGFANGPETQCAAASCAAGAATTASFCDGGGSCKSGTTLSCGNFACGATACKTSCASDADCAPKIVCDVASGNCVAPAATCNDDRSASIPPDGSGPKACAPYLCNPSSGDCFGGCSGSDQCAPGNACDGTSCVPAASGATASSGGCTVGRAPLSSTGFAAIALLVALASRRRSSRGA